MSLIKTRDDNRYIDWRYFQKYLLLRVTHVQHP
jgi:hypothetical protein